MNRNREGLIHTPPGNLEDNEEGKPQSKQNPQEGIITISASSSDIVFLDVEVERVPGLANVMQLERTIRIEKKRSKDQLPGPTIDGEIVHEE